MTARHQSKKSVGKKQAAALIATVLLAVLALLVFIYRDSLSELLSGTSPDKNFSESEPFTFEAGSRQYFSLAGERLAVASTTGLQVLSSKGETLIRQVYSMINPAISEAENACAFYDVGGKALRVYKNDECFEYDRSYPIISVQMNAGGYIAISEQESGYKGVVTVLDETGSEVYIWYSGSGYPVDAAVSPDCSRLAVLSLESSGSVVHVFELNSEKELFSVSLPNELAFKLNFFKSGDFCTLSEDALHFFAADGKEHPIYSFEDSYLAGFELSGEICAVVLSKYVSGSDVSLLSFAPDGDIYGSTPLSGEPVSLFAQKQRLLVLCSDMITIFSRDLRTLSEGRVVAGYKSALLTPKGSILLLTSHYAEEYKI